ncbi:hypothetical protein [Nocardioides sp. 503]|uniref:hypothetical protein n=1 Tax=Nocardioides sp. 503 TaxID=2508326 RepID=UPI00107060A1|nr:hypothetical protein [Nocardioides sp. 503]
MTPPSIYWDRQAARYYAISKWKWVNESYKNDGMSSTCGWRNLGGNDGFGTSFNKGLLLTGYSLTVMYSGGKSWTVANAADANASGVGYRFQDKATRTGCDGSGIGVAINSARGQQVISFKKSGKCKTVYGFAKFGHSWDETGINGVGVGPYSVSFQWTKNENSWVVASQPGATAKVC